MCHKLSRSKFQPWGPDLTIQFLILQYYMTSTPSTIQVHKTLEIKRQLNNISQDERREAEEGRRRRPKPPRLTHICSSLFVSGSFRHIWFCTTLHHTHNTWITQCTFKRSTKRQNNHLNKPKHRGVAECAGRRAWPHKHCCTPTNRASSFVWFLYRDYQCHRTLQNYN